MLAHVDPRHLRDFESWQDVVHEPLVSDEMLANPVAILALCLLLICAAIALLTVPFIWLERKKKQELARVRQHQRRRTRRKPFMKPSGMPSLMSTGKLCPSCGSAKRRSQPWCATCAKDLASRAMKAEQLARRKVASSHGALPPVRLSGEYRDDSPAGSW